MKTITAASFALALGTFTLGSLALAATSDTDLNAKPTANESTTTYLAPTTSNAVITPNAGVALSSLASDQATGLTDRSALDAGVDAEFGREAVRFDTGLKYQQKGAKVASADRQLNLDYITIPAVAKIYYYQGSSTKAYIKAGAAASYLVNHSIEANGQTSKTSGSSFNNFDYGPTAGLGFAFAVSSNADLVIEGNYMRGLNRVNTNGDSALYNSSTGITAGLAIPL